MPYGPAATSDPVAPMASYHDAAWYGGWMAVWHYMCTWVPHLRGRQLAHTGPHGSAPAYQVSVAASWDRLSHAHTLVSAHHDHASLLPTEAHFPELHSRLDHGRFSPATIPLGHAAPAGLDDDAVPSGPSILPDLDCADVTCHPHAHRAASAVVASLAFLALYDASRPAGRARLLDGSTARGPFSFWRRIPVPSSSTTDPPLFAFSDSAEFSVALALDLLVLPSPHSRQ